MKHFTLTVIMALLLAGMGWGRDLGPGVTVSSVSNVMSWELDLIQDYGATIGTGDGSSKANAINIDSIGALRKLAATSDDFGKYVVLTKDIDFHGLEFPTIIGTWTGTFDGNGHTLRNFTITSPDATTNHTAMFTVLGAAGTVRDLVIVNPCIVTAQVGNFRQYAGCIAGEATGGNSHSLIYNCHVRNGSLTFTHDNSDEENEYGLFGMLVGANHGKVEKCTATGTVSGTAYDSTVAHTSSFVSIGGLVGYQTGPSSGTPGALIDSSCDVMVSYNGLITEDLELYMGGMTGFLASSVADNYIDNCHSTGNIVFSSPTTDAYIFIGGFIGNCNNQLTNSSAVCTIDVSDSSDIAAGWLYAGGFVAKTDNANCDISGCFAKVDFKASYDDSLIYGGFTGSTTSSVTIADCYAMGSVWDKNNGSTVIDYRYCGGFIGRTLSDGNVQRCWASMDAYSDGATGTATGWAGDTMAGGTTADNFWDTTTSGISAANTGATGKTALEMMTAATFTNYDTDPTGGRKWKLVTTQYYPQLEWE